ncbi:MAG: flagellar hook basal-body protein [Candidatus Hatepunaea meridiana]|nr:flagellar hook basal-body protein [Candidatus Hatepunaea meridiana]
MNIKLEILKNAMIAQTRKTGVTANNLANLNTSGYKRDVAFVDYLKDSQNSNLKVETDFSQGQLKQTNNPLDLALAGRGFFTVETNQGETYTRNGHFQVGQDGLLKTSNGNPVIGNGGWINISTDGMKAGKINVTTRGEVYQNNELIDVLRIVDFESYIGLKKTGENLFVNTGNISSELVDEPVVKQGNLEVSNVSPVGEMIEMIEIQRQFESSQRTAKIIDSVLGRAVNDIGKYR